MFCGKIITRYVYPQPLYYDEGINRIMYSYNLQVIRQQYLLSHMIHVFMYGNVHHLKVVFFRQTVNIILLL